MGYRKIPNLYQNQEILLFKECYASEKIHGTSAHVSFKYNQQVLHFFSGGEKQSLFEAFFDKVKLKDAFLKLGFVTVKKITVHGESYGGKMQGMRETYGDKVWFTAFEVNIDGDWLSVDKAKAICDKLGIEFVPYTKIPATVEAMDKEKRKKSVVAKWRTGKTHKTREGIVVRPLIELQHNNGGRIITKYKNAKFSERKRKRDTKADPVMKKLIQSARRVADDWVTEMRLVHVLDGLADVKNMSDTPRVINAMIEDILIEGKEEGIKDSPELRRAISWKTGGVLRRYFDKKL